MALRIETKRLYLSPFGPKDITADYISWLNNPDLMKFSQNSAKKHDYDSCYAYARNFDHKISWLWAIRTLDGKHIGNINAFLNTLHNVADIGILMGSNSGQGFGQEAWKGVMTALFTHYKVRKITGGCIDIHDAMKKIMARANMVPDGYRKAHLELRGQVFDVAYFARFSDKFDDCGTISYSSEPEPVW